MLKDSDEELVKSTPITSYKLFEKPKDEIKCEELKVQVYQLHGSVEE